MANLAGVELARRNGDWSELWIYRPERTWNAPRLAPNGPCGNFAVASADALRGVSNPGRRIWPLKLRRCLMELLHGPF